eukprot:6015855-Pyramimonas_sp.AAC.1
MLFVRFRAPPAAHRGPRRSAQRPQTQPHGSAPRYSHVSWPPMGRLRRPCRHAPHTFRGPLGRSTSDAVAQFAGMALTSFMDQWGAPPKIQWRSLLACPPLISAYLSHVSGPRPAVTAAAAAVVVVAVLVAAAAVPAVATATAAAAVIVVVVAVVAAVVAVVVVVVPDVQG